MSKKTQSELGTRHKTLEKKSEKIISKKEHIIVRVDGHKFSKFTKKFEKPFDKIFSELMIRVTETLVSEYKATTGYTQSDEITLVIPSFYKTNDTFTHNLGGRTQKIASLIAGKATSEFIRQFFLIMKDMERTETNERYFKVMESGHIFDGYFDARLYGVKSDVEAFNSVLWRVRDAEKNSISNAAISCISHKTLLGLNGQERKDKMISVGVDWDSYENDFKYGTLVKKIQYQKLTDGNEICIRTKFTRLAKKLTYSKNNVKLIIKKYLTETDSFDTV